MVMIKAHFTDQDVESFFRKNGFVVIPFKRGQWIPEYHNTSRWHEIEVPGVVIPGKCHGTNRVVDALKLFETVSEKRIRCLILGTDRPIIELIRESIHSFIN